MSMVRDQANENLIRDLKANSQYLVLVHETFCSLFAEVNLRTISVHETRLSKTVKVNRNHVSKHKAFSRILIVSKSRKT